MAPRSSVSNASRRRRSLRLMSAWPALAPPAERLSQGLATWKLTAGRGSRPAVPEGRPREATGQGSPATGRSPPSRVLLFWTLTPPTGMDTLKRQEVPPVSRLPPLSSGPGPCPRAGAERRGASAPPPSRAEAESLPPIPTHHGGPWDPDTPSALGSGAAPDARASGAQRRVPRAAMDRAGPGPNATLAGRGTRAAAT